MDEFKDYQGNNGIHKEDYIPLTDILYNNFCEGHIKLVKKLARQMPGFKKIEAARDYIKTYWFLKKRLNSFLR